jgi:D-serine deaminase-like pyridoxal phosphate-dependent protein
VDQGASVALGEALLLVPGHCDPTVNLYDELVCIRGDLVEAVWPIAARGALL